MGESDGHVRRWRDYWNCEDQAAVRRGRLAPPGGAAGVRALPGGAEVLPMWECCQFQCCQFPIGDWQRQTTEWNVAKLPNGFSPNYRTVIARHRLF